MVSYDSPIFSFAFWLMITHGWYQNKTGACTVAYLGDVHIYYILLQEASRAWEVEEWEVKVDPQLYILFF